VAAVTVDSLAQRFGPPDVLYIDVEGYEQHVLDGARQTLEHVRPDCFVEIHVAAGLEQFAGSIPGILAHFPPARYDLFVRDADERAEFAPITADVVHRRTRFFLTALARRAAT
jgi:hypothetical protein